MNLAKHTFTGRDGIMTTIKDIAKHLHISTSTVSRAINGHPEISDKTKKMVMTAVEELGYIPNRFAQQLVGCGALTVGFTIPDINDSFFAKCAVGAEGVICQRGHDIAYHSIQRNTARLCEFLVRAKELRYSSVIITPEYWDKALFQQIARTQMPTVILRRKTPDDVSDIPYVDSDHYGGVRELCRHLIELGHRHIAFITYDAIVLNERRQGYEDAMLRGGLPEYVFECRRTTNSDQVIPLGYGGMQEVLKRYPQVTAVIGANDMLAIGAMQALHEAGIRVPEEMSVAGFDNRAICDLYNIQLTTVEQPLRELGCQAAEMALRLAKDPADKPASVIMKTKLIVRHTTAQPR